MRWQHFELNITELGLHELIYDIFQLGALFYSIAVPHRLFDLGIRKKTIQPSFAFPSLYRDFYRLLTAISIDHWPPRMLFVYLINQTRFHNSFSKQLLITAFYNLF